MVTFLQLFRKLGARVRQLEGFQVVALFVLHCPAHIFPRSADDIVVRSQIYGNARWQVFQTIQCEMIIVLGVFDIEYESRESGER